MSGLQPRKITSRIEQCQAQRLSMPGHRLAIDGLWRCLCPSFDSQGLSQLRRLLRRAPTRLCVPANSTLNEKVHSRRAQSRHFHSGGTLHASSRRDLERLLVRGRHHFVSKDDAFGSNNSSTPPAADAFKYIKLDEVPVAELQDVLQVMKDKEGEYHKTLDLVKLLIQRAGGKPELAHYNALISANADANNGSAVIVAKLLQDMKEVGIVADSGLYHKALQVCYSLHFRKDTSTRLILRLNRLSQSIPITSFVERFCVK
jgi:hypothetical protein